MWIAFHEDPVDVAEMCDDLREHGAVYWHSMRPAFASVAHEIEARGVPVTAWCARPSGDFMNFLVRSGARGEGLDMLEAVAEAIIRWQELGEPVPHVEPVRMAQ